MSLSLQITIKLISEEARLHDYEKIAHLGVNVWQLSKYIIRPQIVVATINVRTLSNHA